MDRLTKEERSRNMKAIRSRDTKPEIYIRKLLFREGLRYRINKKTVEGHPDLFLRKYNTAVFIHGCFWHRHPDCKYAYTPKSREDFWNKKFDDNIRRDRYVKEVLYQQKIKCLVIWECTVKKMQHNTDFEKEVLNSIISFLNNRNLFYEL